MCHEAITGSRCTVPLILNLSTTLKEVTISCPSNFNPNTQWLGSWMGPRASTDILKQIKLSSPLPKSNHCNLIFLLAELGLQKRALLHMYFDYTLYIFSLTRRIYIQSISSILIYLLQHHQLAHTNYSYPLHNFSHFCHLIFPRSMKSQFNFFLRA